MKQYYSILNPPASGDDDARRVSGCRGRPPARSDIIATQPISLALNI